MLHYLCPSSPHQALLRLALSVAATVAPATAIAEVALQSDDVLIGEQVVPLEGGANGFNDYANLSLEELMSISVSSVTGVEQDWFTTPAAIYVITNEDIRRSGHLLLPEALRLAPGLSVGRINSHKWAIGSRGFGGRYANKLQVLVDGRVVYDSLFAGTFWELQGVLMEDVQQIEVIRGPGATLWGANAVNGVINVTTRSARDTQGLYVMGGAGTLARAFGAVRYGDELGDDTWFRVWTNYYSGDNTERVGGGDSADDWDLTRGGFRIDHEGADNTTLTFQGELYGTDRLGEEQVLQDPTTPFTSFVARQDMEANGANLIARVSREDEAGGWSFQTYYDHAYLLVPSALRSDRHTVDLDWRHHFKLGDRNELMWGLGYRHSYDDTRNAGSMSMNPSDRQFQTYSAFIQDTFTVVPDRLFVMAGSKFEHNDFSGFEVQPSARAWWTPNDRHTVWASISRAVRVPSRADHDLAVTVLYGDAGLLGGGPPNGVPVPIIFTGDDSVDPEELIAYELGHRVRVTDDFTIDTALFFNDYDNLVVPDSTLLHYRNAAGARSYGGEVSAVWHVADNWRLEASYSFVNIEGGEGAGVDGNSPSEPNHQFQIRSYLDITDDLELNSALYFVDDDAAYDTDEYFRLDIGVTWRPRPNVEVAIWGQNLLEHDHVEATDLIGYASATEVPRSVFGQVTFRF